MPTSPEDEWRADLVSKYGEAVVKDIEQDAAASVPWDCRDTMDGRHWCRVHNASWPSFTGTGCSEALNLSRLSEEATDAR